MPTKRLNISLLNDDVDTITELRNVLEAKLNKRLSFADVVRLAILNIPVDELANTQNAN